MFTPLAVIGIVFGSALILARMIIAYKRDALQSAPAADKSLSTSELREMIDEAVQEASAPLRERIEHLETRSGLKIGPVSDEYDVDDLSPDHVSYETEVRRRTQ